MNGIENIVSKILADAQLQAGEILSAAKKEEQEILAEYKKDAERESARLLDGAKKALAAREARLSAVAELEGRKAILGVKQEIIGKAFDDALHKLLNLPEDKYAAFLAKLAASASKTGDEEIMLSPGDRDKFGAKAAEGANRLLNDGALSLSALTADIKGGLILKSGDIEINCDLAVQVRMCRENLAKEIASALFS
jgi:V/A-type H+-transporting ATPase subunit E